MKNVVIRDFALEAEQAVLGCLLIGSEKVADILALLTADDFSREAHAEIFRSIQVLHGRGAVDLVTVTEHLRNNHLLGKVGGPVYLANLSESVGFVKNALDYALIVKETAYKQKLIKTLRSLISDLESNFDARLEDLVTFTASSVDGLLTLIDCFRQNRPKILSGDELLASVCLNNPEVIGDGILPGGGGLIIAGEAGIGKSLLVLEMAVRLSHGLSLWGLPVCDKHKVLLINRENSIKSLKFRLERLLAGLGLSTVSNLFFLPPEAQINLSTPEGLQAFKLIIRKLNPQVCVLDPLSAFHMVQENDNRLMRGCLDQLTMLSREVGVAWIVTHHHGKANELGQTKYRGASSIRDWADSFVNLTPKKSPDRTILELEFDKLRHSPPRPSLILERDENLCHHPADLNLKVSPKDVAQALAQLGGRCEGQAKLVKKIVEATGCGQRTAYRAINAAAGKEIEVVEKGGVKTFFLPRAVAKTFCHGAVANENSCVFQ